MTTSVISRTGRVQSWMDDPTSRLPVSCTVFVVQDSMEGPDGIEASWRFVSHALRFGAGCAVHLSELRPKGAENGKGLVASGPVSFAKIYSTLNEILRRGGVFTRMVLWCVILTFVTLMPLSLFRHLEQNCHGSSDASTSLKVGGGRARSRKNFYNPSKLEMSGSTK